MSKLSNEEILMDFFKVFEIQPTKKNFIELQKIAPRIKQVYFDKLKESLDEPKLVTLNQMSFTF